MAGERDFSFHNETDFLFGWKNRDGLLKNLSTTLGWNLIHGGLLGNFARYDYNATWMSDEDVYRRNTNSVIQEFLTLFPATVELSLTAILFAVIIGLPAGVIAGGDSMDPGTDYPVRGSAYSLLYTTDTPEEARVFIGKLLAGGGTEGMPFAAAEQLCTVGEGVLHMVFDLGHGAFVDQRALGDAAVETAANLQLRHALGHGVPGAEHEDGGGIGVTLPKRAAHGEAVHAGQHDVQHDAVKALLQRHAQARVAVARTVQ